MFIVSFGGSDSYRFCCDGNVLRTSQDLHYYLKDKFPGLSNLKYFSKAEIKKLTPEEESKYCRYPLLDETTVKDIEKRLKREVQTGQAVKALNNATPWADMYNKVGK